MGSLQARVEVGVRSLSADLLLLKLLHRVLLLAAAVPVGVAAALPLLVHWLLEQAVALLLLSACSAAHWHAAIVFLLLVDFLLGVLLRLYGLTLIAPLFSSLKIVLLVFRDDLLIVFIIEALHF